MKASLQLQLSQQLTLTPQLQQAIKLLQLSAIELQQEIQQAIETNPFLEIEELSNAHQNKSLDQEGENQYQDAPLSHAWEMSKPRHQISEEHRFDNINAAPENLQDHLLWQMRLTPLSETDKQIATAIIDAVDTDGYLSTTLSDIAMGLNQNCEEPIEIDELEAVHKTILRFDPVGVGSRDLQECIKVQLLCLPDKTPWKSEAIEIISKHIQALGQKNYPLILKNMSISQQTLENAIKLIKHQNPKPGLKIASERTEYIVPDVVVKKIEGEWVVSLNQSNLPNLRINDHYTQFIGQVTNKNDLSYLKTNLQEARWLLKSIQSRNQTLLKVASFIVSYQREFLEHGDVAMKPLVLSTIAESLDMHESTISRVTTQKYLHTPRGIFELKYFFSSHVQTDTGGEASAVAIRAFIKQIIADENRTKPLSDKQIADILCTQGIKIARRTIAKYRETIGIPPSHERKCMFSDSR